MLSKQNVLKRTNTLKKPTIPIKCPYCNNGRVYTNDQADVRVSVLCPNCGRAFVANLATLKSVKPKEDPEIESRPMILRLSCPCPGCQGTTWADGTADILISVKCPKKHVGIRNQYSRYYVGNLRNGNTKSVLPIFQKKILRRNKLMFS